MKLNRRQFTFGALTSMLFIGWSCSKTTDLLGSLQDILKRVEATLTSLGLMTGLAADLIAEVAAYLSSVAQFVDNVAKLLEDEALSIADKTKQILEWASGLNVPHVSNQAIQSLLMQIAATVDKFLSFWKGTTPPEIKYTPDVHRYLSSIESQAMADKHKVEEWEKAPKK